MPRLRHQAHQQGRIVAAGQRCAATSVHMSVLNASQTDALTELINIAFGLTASKLSEISGQRVLLEAPVVSIHPVDDLAKELESFVTGEVASIHQVFTGSFSGDAILF